MVKLKSDWYPSFGLMVVCPVYNLGITGVMPHVVTPQNFLNRFFSNYIRKD